MDKCWPTSPVIALPTTLLSGERRSDTAIAHLADEALMQRYGSGDREAFEVLYRRHRARLYTYIRRVVGPTNDPEEIFQEVWLAVIKGRHRYVASSRFVAFLFTIAHNRIAESHRKRSRGAVERINEDAEASIPDESFGPLDTALNTELGKALLSAIAVLPVAQREAFLMQAEGDLTLDEIAVASGTSRETVKSRLRYANRRLRRALEKWR